MYRFDYRSLPALVALSAAIAACAGTMRASTPPTESTLAAEVIFHATSALAAPSEAGILLEDSTLRFSQPPVGRPARDLDSAAIELLPALMQENATRQPVTALQLGEHFRIVHRDTLRAIFGDRARGWIRFLEAFPRDRGYYATTRPVFALDSASALVFVEYHCGYLCGEGDLFFVRRDGQRWRTVRQVRYWVS